MARLAATASWLQSTPFTSTRPSLGFRMPMRSLKVVVFPAPLGPSNPNTSPAFTVRFTDRSAGNEP